jgi:hypothetical protein
MFWGGCVSRVTLIDGHQDMHGIADDEMKLGYFLDKQNIVCAMMPPPFSREDVEQITADELWDKSRLVTLKQCLNKDTIKLLMESDAEYLVMDLYDMQTYFTIYGDTCFSNCAFEAHNTALIRNYINQGCIQIGNFFDMDSNAWYGRVEEFFNIITKKYDSDHIILNRFRCNTYFLDKDGIIKPIPPEFMQVYQPNPKYNTALARLEDYIISNYKPYVIDLTKYFMGDANTWDNIQGAHFETEFYRESFDQIKRIIKDGSKDKYYSKPNFFNVSRRGYEEDKARKFDVESNMNLMLKLLDKEDILWLNILDKLNTYAPEDDRVKQYVTIAKENLQI